MTEVTEVKEEDVIATMSGDEVNTAIKAGTSEEKKKRKIVIETDGKDVEITELELSPLEVKEVCRMILKQLGG